MNTSGIYTAILNIIYPVGSIIQNYEDSTNPGDRIPGTSWVRLDNVFLVNEGSFGYRVFKGGDVDNLSTGGEATVLLEPKHLPSHSHQIGYYDSEIGGADPDGWIRSDEHTQTVFGAASPTKYTALTAAGTYTTSDAGDNNYRHDNMPPYTRVYGWYRIA